MGLSLVPQATGQQPVRTGSVDRPRTRTPRIPVRAVTSLLLAVLFLSACRHPSGRVAPQASPPSGGTVAAASTAADAVSIATAAGSPGGRPGPATTPATATPATPAPARSYFVDHRIVAYYGNPLSPILGALGEDEPNKVVARLQQQAAAYARLDQSRQVTPALELIEAVAQDTPTDNKLYLYYTDPSVVDTYSKVAQENGMLLILDEQIGRSTPQAETQRLMARLSQPHVQLALDPEFDMKPGEVPGDTLGSMDAADINQVQAMLEETAVRNGLPSKILIIHLFQLDMLTHPEQLRTYPHVDLVLEADGFGTRSIKQEKYEALITNRPTGHPGLKLFYKYDPNIWTPADVLQLSPPPDIIIYQ